MTHFVPSYSHILKIHHQLDTYNIVTLEMKVVKDLNQLMPVTLASAGGSQEECEPTFLYLLSPRRK